MLRCWSTAELEEEDGVNHQSNSLRLAVLFLETLIPACQSEIPPTVCARRSEGSASAGERKWAFAVYLARRGVQCASLPNSKVEKTLNLRPTN